MSETEKQQIEVEEQSELITQLVSSTSAQIKVTAGDDNGEMIEESSLNGCDSTTEVNESVLEPAGSQEVEPVESTSQGSDDGDDTLLDSTDKTETSSFDDAHKTEEPPPQTSESHSENESSAVKTSRELKSILALSKEAKLDTNLSTHRRKTLDKVKGKLKSTMKITNFPVTAESELENFDVKIEEKSGKKVAKKRKSSLVESVTEGAAGEDTKKSLQQGVQGLSDDFVMLKKPNKDIFCWRCHHDCVQIACETCPRTYHLKCLKQTVVDVEHWPCPECVSILKAENTQTRSKAMKGMSLEHLCSLLKFAVKRMIQCSGSEPFIHSVDEKQFPEYRSYIIQPMTLTMLEKNIKDNSYGSTQAFEADAKWILHNNQSKLTTAAKTIVKICKQEMAEIENCPSCYLNANTKKHTWFVEVCPKPHLLVWAKLKGFPYWPAKVMSINSSGMADVRFFGAHDKAWVNVKECYLYSVKDPNSGKQKRNDIIECVKELELYVDNLREIYGRVNFAPFKTPLEPDSQLKQLQIFLPNYRNDGKESSKKVKDFGKVDGKTLNRSVSNENLNSDERNSSSESEDDNDEEDENKDDGKAKKKNEENTSGDIQISCHFAKERSMTRIDYRDTSSDKPKLIAKPIKTILIRKRYSTDNVTENAPKILRANITKRNDSVRLSLDNHVKTTANAETKNKTIHIDEHKSTSPQSKLKITDQLIKKLEDLDEEKDLNKNDEKSEAEPDKKADDVNEVSSKHIESENLNSDQISGQSEARAAKEKEDNKNVSVESNENIKSDEKVAEVTEIQKFARENSSELDESHVMEEDEGAKSVQNTEVEMDEANIRNIIHSSLVTPENSSSKKTEVEVNKKRKRVEETKDDSREETEEMKLFPPNKMVKLVPIENILQKKNDVVEINTDTTPNKPEQLIVLKEIRVVKDGKEVKNKTNQSSDAGDANRAKETPVKIKNEVESDDDNNDVQYMEAKRQYLSALNISEKQKFPIKPKAHEIRTRSKTEEKKSKSVDNLTKVIEDVASRSTDNPAVVNKTIEPVKEIYIKSLSKMQTPKHKARKSFPTPNYNKKTIVARKLVPKTGMDDELTIVNATTLQPTGNVMILPKLHYNKPIPINRDISSPPVLTMLPRPSAEPSANKKILEGSQNYIPQNEEEALRNAGGSSSGGGGGGGILLNNLLTGGSVSTPPIVEVESQSSQIDVELGALKEILPENVSKGVSEILCQPPPKLKPKPLNILNNTVDSGAPSTAGPLSSRINTITQKLSDYFRGLLVEAINDLGKSNNPEAAISSLKYEIEELNHKHGIELAEIRRNVSIVLKDIQKCVVEERERIINETKANCEIEMMKRVEEAKSKQWCANCSKEAQFYCCWNTSYCDYPCQQKHWLKHMSKCTQTASQNQTVTTTPVRQSGQQLVLTPTTAPKFGALFAKPQKVYLKRTNTPFKQTTGSHITLVESTPGNFELLGSGPIAVNGKILASTSVIEKIKSGNIVTVTAPS
ncbi:protein kinase C-binding protein 1, partial [Asbolus verrucosus]